MKKRPLPLRAASLALSAAVALAAAPTIQADASVVDGYYLVGDIVGNDDGTSGLDALAIMEYDAKVRAFSDDELMFADVNHNGKVNRNDAVAILQWNAGTVYRLATCAEYVTPELQKVPDQAAYNDRSACPTIVSEGSNSGVCADLSAINSYTVAEGDAYSVGNYKVRLRYKNDSNQVKKVKVATTDGYIIVDCAPTGSEWGEQAVVFHLDKTGPFLVYITAQDTGGPILDTLQVCRTSNVQDKIIPQSDDPVPPTTEPITDSPVTTTVTAPVTTTTAAPETTVPATTTTAAPSYEKRYYAYEAKYYDSWEEDTNAGFAGKCYINYNNAIGSYVDWTVDVPADGSYEVTFRYSNGSTTDRPVKIMVNGEHKQALYLDCAGTGAWTDWAETTLVLDLKAGTNTIMARATTTGGGPNMDYIELKSTDKAAQALGAATDGRIMENLNRGVSNAHAKDGNLVSWRHLANDNANTTFDLWRIRESGNVKLGTFTMEDASTYFDTEGTASDWYTIDTYVDGECTEFANASINLPNTNSGQSGAYFDINTQTPPAQTMPDGSTCTYTENDCSVGDVDGDGQYEIFVKWDPSNSQDNSKTGYTGSVYIDCYKLDSTLLWRIDLGKNIRAGAHYTQFMVADFDLDGKAEMICKTADGTKDGQGNSIGNASADYRNSSGTVLSGPEYITLFDGATGKALDTQDYDPARGEQSKETWGDNYGNRSERYTACVAYLDGEKPSACFGRGYYTRLAVAAWDVVNKKLSKRWVFDTGFNSSVAGYGDGNHHELGADVDGDGKDEVVCGSAVIDDNGKLLYTSGMAHGDAIHIGDFVPSNPGVEIFQCLEDEKHPNGTAVNFGTVLRSGKDGTVLFRETADGDTGRCIADNLVAGNEGAEMCGSHNGILYDCVTGKQLNDLTFASITKWGQNSVVYWTDVLERAVLDRTMADQYGQGRVFTGDGVSYNNSTKSNACITCDLFGDWREEMVFRKSDGGLRVFSTTYTTEYPIYTLMQNPQYRVQVAAQNNGYNQPPHTDYFLGTGHALPVAPEIRTAG